MQYLNAVSPRVQVQLQDFNKEESGVNEQIRFIRFSEISNANMNQF